MTTTQKWFLYTAYVLAAASVFIYVLFPTAAVKRFIGVQLTKRYPDVQVTIGNIKPTLPPGLRLDRIGLQSGARNWLDIEVFKCWPALQSLPRAAKKINFKATVASGKIEGQVTLDSAANNHRLALTSRLSGIELDRIAALAALQSPKLGGTLSGNVDVDPTGNTSAKFVLAPCRVEVVLPLIELERIEFQTVEADLTLANGRIQIKECILKGKQLDGLFAGFITPGTPPADSRIDLKGSLKLHHVFLTALRETIPADLFPKRRTPDGGFPLQISGTLAKPSFSFR